MELVLESANAPMFDREALQSRENIKVERSRGNTRNGLQSKPKGSSFATNLSQSATPAVSHGAGNSNRSSNRPLCQFCSRYHDLDDCDQFSKLTAEQKRAFLREKQLCFGCYGKHHISKHCVNKRRCKHCGGRHPTALDIDGFQLVKQEDSKNCAKPEAGMSNTGSNLQRASCNAIKPEETVILHALLPVKVKKRGSNETITTYAFYDNSSGGCFLTENLREQIGAEGERMKLQLGTMHGQSFITTTVVDDLIIMDMEDNNPLEIPKCYTRMDIPVTTEQIPTPDVLKQWEHLQEVAEKMPKFMPSVEIGMLIGSNCPLALEPLEVVPSKGEGPYAM